LDCIAGASGDRAEEAGRRLDSDSVLRVLGADLPAGDGVQQHGPPVGLLPHPGRRQVLQTHSGHAPRRPPRKEKVSLFLLEIFFPIKEETQSAI